MSALTNIYCSLAGRSPRHSSPGAFGTAARCAARQRRKSSESSQRASGGGWPLTLTRHCLNDLPSVSACMHEVHQVFLGKRARRRSGAATQPGQPDHQPGISLYRRGGAVAERQWRIC